MPVQVIGVMASSDFPRADHKFKKDVKDDQIVVMRLPSKEELENWSKKFREMFR